MKQNLKHQDLLDQFALAVLPSTYRIHAQRPATHIAEKAYQVAKAMMEERANIIALRNECEVKQRLNIKDCSDCPERNNCGI